MGLDKITKSRGYKNFMSKLYGIGASIVIIGALFKINHYNYADIMLIAGLGTESIIFFFSAFEPPHVEPDWSLVYPELAGLYHSGKTIPVMEKSSLTDELDQMLTEANIDSELIDNLGKGLNKLSVNTEKLSDLSLVGEASNEFTQNLQTASKSVEALSSSYNNQTDAIKGDIEVSSKLNESVKAANESVESMTNAYRIASENMSKDLSVTEEFARSIQETTNNTNALNEQYKKSVKTLTESAEALDFSALKENKYNDQLEKLSTNLSSLNTVYELQLQNSQAQAESTNKLQEGMNKLMEVISGGADNTVEYQNKLNALNKMYELQINNASQQADSSEKVKQTLDEFLAKLTKSADKTVQYNAGLDELSKKVNSLNQVYGNMLSAMNVKS